MSATLCKRSIAGDDLLTGERATQQVQEQRSKRDRAYCLPGWTPTRSSQFARLARHHSRWDVIFLLRAAGSLSISVSGTFRSPAAHWRYRLLGGASGTRTVGPIREAVLTQRADGSVSG